MKSSKSWRMCPLSFTAYQALQNFAIFSESLYCQYFTWDRSSWKPHPTKRKKLGVWYFMSLLLILTTVSYFWIIFQQILAHQKDPKFTIVTSVLFMLNVCVYAYDVVVIMTQVCKVKELCFVLGNLQIVKESTVDIGGMLKNLIFIFFSNLTSTFLLRGRP